jgi:Tfp pilus assembly protein PilO
MPEKIIRVLTKREKTILYITIVIFILSLGFNFFIVPILTKNEKLNKEIILARTRLKKHLQLLSQKEYIQSEYNKFSSNYKASNQQEGTLGSALSELENLAKNANIRIVDIRPEATKNLALYKEILIDLRTEGTMEGYLKFIYDLENSLSLLRIKRLRLSSKLNSQALEGSFSISQLSPKE